MAARMRIIGVAANKACTSAKEVDLQWMTGKQK